MRKTTPKTPVIRPAFRVETPMPSRSSYLQHIQRHPSPVSYHPSPSVTSLHLVFQGSRRRQNSLPNNRTASLGDQHVPPKSTKEDFQQPPWPAPDAEPPPMTPVVRKNPVYTPSIPPKATPEASTTPVAESQTRAPKEQSNGSSATAAPAASLGDQHLPDNLAPEPRTQKTYTEDLSPSCLLPPR